MSKEKKIREFIEDLEAIASSQVSDSRVIGLDFIALGGDDNYFQDYLIHSKSIDDYLKTIDEFFRENPSLLVTRLEYEIAKISCNNREIESSDIKLTFQEKQIPNTSNFTTNYEKGKETKYWKKWCEIISNFYPNCNSILFIKLSFGSLDKTTALFVYFNSDISIIDDRRKGWLSKASKAFLYEEAVSVFLPKHIEKIEEVEGLKTKTMFSLTTHSLKTHLNTTVIKTKNAFRDNKLCQYPELKQAFEEHSREVDTLFHLTELLSLIDKIDDSTKFKEAATEVLFSDTKVSYNLKEHLEKFNERHTTSPDIKIIPEIEAFNFAVTVYGLYFGEKLLELLFNTIFENIIAYGKKTDDGKKKLNIEISNDCWRFKNETVDESPPFNQEQVKGNLQLFKKLINETKSGTFNIEAKEHKFEIKVKKGK